MASWAFASSAFASSASIINSKIRLSFFSSPKTKTLPSLSISSALGFSNLVKASMSYERELSVAKKAASLAARLCQLGDFGLAKWKTTDDWTRTRVIGTLGYLAPEYAENGIVSVRTDVSAFGIVLLQLISGRKVVDVNREGQDQYLLQWAEPLIERLALHELIDPCIGESYDTYELYHMAKASYLCVRRNPEMRPSMDEVVRLLEGENDNVKELAQQFMPHFTK
ncbi:receptor-like cytosolic serine/threonine-protein kinase RBK2 isoform X4 [Tasmannia lanceolata]|uniref:receptor-like cytosolic serine/threonine-protein kinase RBK2 isoform X4 n=1 Tax=Tasmannia lanceolata TaxID=3420 RepID=UPI004064B0AC